MKCSFCNEEIPKGTGFIFVKKDGKALYFCSQKCKKNMINLKRVGKKTEWTKFVQEKKKEEKQKKEVTEKAEKPKKKKAKRRKSKK